MVQSRHQRATLPSIRLIHISLFCFLLLSTSPVLRSPTTRLGCLHHWRQPEMNFTTGATASEILSLDNIRNQLIRLEDTIIFCESGSGSGPHVSFIDSLSTHRTCTVCAQPSHIPTWCIQGRDGACGKLARMVSARDRVVSR